MPAYAAFYACFEATKRRLRTRLNLGRDQNPPTWGLLLAGSTGGIGYVKAEIFKGLVVLTSGSRYWLASYPLDVIKCKPEPGRRPRLFPFANCLKARVQMAERPPPGGFFYISKAFSSIYRQEGIKPFFRGLSTALIRSVPAAASTLTMYTLTEEWLSKNTSL